MTYLGEKIIGNFRTKTKKPKSREHRQDEAHLDWIRTLPCCICESDGSDPHHLLSIKDARGMAMKSQDWWTVPLCRRCHDRLHKEAVADTEHSWFSRNGLAWVYQYAERLWRLSGDSEAAGWILRGQRK